MTINRDALDIVKTLTWNDVLPAVGIFAAAWIVSSLLQWMLHHLAEKLPARFRLWVLRLVPLSRLLIGIGAVAIIVPLFIQPEFHKIVTILASIGLTLAFAFKDYGSSLRRVL